MGYRYIDSGAMYRAVTLFVIMNDIPLDELERMNEEQIRSMMQFVNISFHVNTETGFSEVYLNEVNVEKRIRDLQVSDLVSPVSAIPAIRHELVAQQQAYGERKGVVMDGRDIGTKVFPEAEVKIFMTAKKEIRAKRRFDELNAKGFMVTMDEVIENLESRDHSDTHRTESPLRKAIDAVVLDNSHMTEEEQLEFALDLIRQHGIRVPEYAPTR